MKRILLFITATLLLASGTSCSDDNTNFDPIGDELGIPYKDGHDVYGVEVWTPEEVSFTDYYSLIDSTIHEKNTTKSIWWFGAIDGIRNRFQELYYLTLPCMRPQLMFGAVMQITASFSVSAVPITLTGFPSTNDSTTTVITHVLDISTLRMEMGYACAIATVLFLVMLLTRNIISLIIKSD